MKIKKIDITIILSVLCLICISFLSFKFYYISQSNSQLIAIIEQDNKEINRINLSEVKNAYYIDIDSSYPTRILVEPYKISFYKSNCPDKICEHYGTLSKPGQCAVCLPAKVVIKINGVNQIIDSVTG